MFRMKIKLAEMPIKVNIKSKDICKVSAVDQFGSQDFCLGFNGFSRSPLAIALRTQDEQIRQAILSGLNERVSHGDVDVSDSDLIRDLVPRSVQSPAEIQQYVEMFNASHPYEPPKTIDGATDPDGVIHPANGDTPVS